MLPGDDLARGRGGRFGGAGADVGKRLAFGRGHLVLGHRGAAAHQLTQTIQVANAGISAYVVENLAPGTYYFAVRAYTSNGAESSDSNVIARVVQ